MTIEQDQLTVTRRGLRQKEAMHFIILILLCHCEAVFVEAIPHFNEEIASSVKANALLATTFLKLQYLSLLINLAMVLSQHNSIARIRHSYPERRRERPCDASTTSQRKLNMVPNPTDRFLGDERVDKHYA
jgi:hypothetical protein